MIRLLCFLFVLIPSLCVAEILPAKGKQDERVRVVDYDPDQVVRVNTYYGVVTLIRFGEGETIEDHEVGDSKAWTLKVKKNYLFLKPIDKHADTNFMVITNKRIYQFTLFVEELKESDAKAWRSGNLTFSLRFRYPEEQVVEKKVVEEKLSKDRIKADLNVNNPNDDGMNFDYWVAGSPEVSPTSARDNGRFMYLTFARNRDMPSVHEVDGDGNEIEVKEALVQTTVSGSSIVIEKRIRRLILRKGDFVACVVNKSFDSTVEQSNLSGTASQSVIRVIKGAQQ